MHPNEVMESTIRRLAWLNHGTASLSSVFYIARRRNVEEKQAENALKDLCRRGRMKVTNSHIIVDFTLKAQDENESKIRDCIENLRRSGIDPDPSDILEDFEIAYGKVHNAESFLRDLRRKRESLNEKVTQVVIDSQKSLEMFA